MSELFGGGEARVGDLSKFDAERLEETIPALLERASGVSWYGEPGAAVDVAVARLCLLRRARAGVGASAEAGDDAVRRMLAAADPEIVVWLLSRTVSYLDEQGFPDFVPGARADD